MQLMQQMAVMGHEQVVFHQDPESGLRAIIAVHDTTLGNALGGTRRWCYASEDEALHDVLRLSEGMTYKAAAAGLAMGGAKSVIMLGVPAEEATPAQGRAMGRFVESLGGRYIAAEDVGVSEAFCDWMAHETAHVMGGVTVSRGGNPAPYTSLGAFNAMRACLVHAGRPADFAGVRVGIQGLGETGYRLAKMISEHGGSVIGTDVNPVAIKRAVDTLDIKVLGDDEVLHAQDLDIFAPCALGGCLGEDTIDHLNAMIVCGTANNILVNPEHDSELLKDKSVIYAPDFIANAGGVIRLAGLHLGLTEDEIDVKVAEIETTTATILKNTANHASAYATALAYARERINAKHKVQLA